MSRPAILLLVGVSLCAAVVGCGNGEPVKPRILPVHIQGTVGQYADYIGPAQRSVQGYGIVLALGQNGSSEIHPDWRKYLVRYLRRQKLGSYREGTAHLDPDRILRDPDTAAVLVGGLIPYGAPVGARFDVRMSAVAQTRSLDGGRLMPAELRLAVRGRTTPGADTQTWAMATGDVFINPFIDPAKPAEQGELRKGKVIGGGVVTKATPVDLVLALADYSRCVQIRDRINQRFRDPQSDVANATSRLTIKLRIPRPFRRDSQHFLALVRHMPLATGAVATEAKTRQVLRAMYLPQALHNELALVLEATGRQAMPMVQTEYNSTDQYVAYYCARTGLRLGDTAAARVLLQFCQLSDSPLQLAAIEEIGKHPDLTEAVGVLRKLVDDDSLDVRVAACEALLRHGDSRAVRRIDIGGRFELDVVKTSGQPVIYATQTNEQRLILFGDGMPVTDSVFYNPPDELVVISDVTTGQGRRLMITRKIPRLGRQSGALHTGFTVAALVRTMGAPAEKDVDNNIRGLALTYGQVLRVLYGMCNSGYINARFILERPGGSRIRRGSGSIGRPDATEL